MEHDPRALLEQWNARIARRRKPPEFSNPKLDSSRNMPEYITNIAVVTIPAEGKQLQEKGFRRVRDPENINKYGRGEQIWYKKTKNKSALTSLQFSDGMCEDLEKAGYGKITDPIKTAEGPVFLCFFSGSNSNDFPIVDLLILRTPEEEAKKKKEGWEKVGCNLTPVGGKSQHLWIRREKKTCVKTAKQRQGIRAFTGRFHLRRQTHQLGKNTI